MIVNKLEIFMNTHYPKLQKSQGGWENFCKVFGSKKIIYINIIII